jgi:hypothetical protein
VQPASTPPSSAEIDAPIEGASRTRALWLIAGFLLLQLAIPLRYYLGDDIYDERFAWRMFSQVRVQECGAEVTEDGRRLTVLGRDPSDPGILPAPWQALLSRNRPAVVHRFLSWRCENAPEGTGSVRVTTTCTDTHDAVLPPIVREIDCATGEITEEGGAE